MEMTMPIGAIRLKLLELRTQRGLTQAELARKTGLHPLTISRLEGEPRQAEFDTLAKICAALGIGLNELIVYEKSESK